MIFMINNPRIQIMLILYISLLSYTYSYKVLYQNNLRRRKSIDNNVKLFLLVPTLPILKLARNYHCSLGLKKTFILNSVANEKDNTNNIIDNTKQSLITTKTEIVKERIKIVLNENDLEEKFVRATGNGGQKVNKSSSKVELIHKPTGLKTTCQDARDLSTNRYRARKLMIDKLDLFYNMDLSKIAKKQELTRNRKKNAIRKSKKKYGHTKSTTNSNNNNNDDENEVEDLREDIEEESNEEEESEDILSEEEMALIRSRTS